MENHHQNIEKRSNEIKCPNCNEVFKVDETAYSLILRQVKDEEFKQFKKETIQFANREKSDAVRIATNELEIKMNKALSDKDNYIAELQSKLKSISSLKDMEIDSMKKSSENNLSLARNQFEQLRRDYENNTKIIKSNFEHEKYKIENEANNENNNLKIKIKDIQHNQGIELAACKDKYESMINDREKTIERLRDFKLKLSTKMVGESLEEHCENEFNKIRTSAYPNAYFEKDNDISSGSKGDYIFRDFDEFNNEFLSIMFDMKNESDATVTKKRNKDFFTQLDKDRLKKGCEYAVLVSLLEQDSDLYNQGIVEVHSFKKMYVVRPQAFLVLISLLRNMALNTLEDKREIARIKEEKIDIMTFYENLNNFKSSFSTNSSRYHKKFDEAIKGIDNAIKDLEKTKDALLRADDNLRIANNKLQELTLRKLTKNSPTMAKKFSDENVFNKESH